MPTIGQLPAATSVSDSDEIPIFQNGQTLYATRAQILAGVQTALSLPQNTLLGSAAPGKVPPVPITIGANLALTGTTLSATATPFQISALTAGVTPALTDVVAVGQNGTNAGVSYANFLAGISAVPGLSGDAMNVTPTGATIARTLAALSTNAVSIEDFGAAGDGVTDDSPALLAALASGNPVRFGAKTYAIAGECDIAAASCTLLGIPGLTVITRPSQSKLGSALNPAWLSISATTLFIDGMIFDANAAIIADTSAVTIQSGCTKSVITRSVFRNAKGPMQGSGLTYLASDPAITQHHVDECEFTANAVNGISVEALVAFSITNSRAHDNFGNGINVNSEDPAFVAKIRRLHVAGNTCWNNSCGISVGNFSTNNIVATAYGNANPDVLGALVASNNCYSNTSDGIYISGRNILVTENLCANNSAVGSGAGISCNTGYCRISGNMVSGASSFGINCGGSIYTEVTNNYINGASTGLNVGGGQYCTARDNFIQDCTGQGISVQNVESDDAGINFGIACSNLSITGNWINYGGTAIGIFVRDAPQNILVQDNIIVADPGANPLNAISAYTDSLILRGNLLNVSSSFAVNPGMLNGAYTLVVPDIVDAVSVTQSTSPISSIITAQASAATGQVTFAKIVYGGNGYTTASVSFAGTGTGATASAWISGGKVIGIQMDNAGSGYGPGTTVSITGNGSGSTATVQVGLPVLQNRLLSITCLTSTTFAAAGSSPLQTNWTGAPITVPAGATIDWTGNNNTWRAARFSQSDYVSPNGDGSLTLRTQSGDISLHPAGAGVVRLLSDEESTGAVELIGRGSPLSVISAPPGSTFRNLNGGVGSTFWVKQSGSGSLNWVAVA